MNWKSRETQVTSGQITMDEWLAELAKANAGAEGFTTAEAVERTGLSRYAIIDRIKVDIHKGRIAYVGQRTSVSISGRKCQVPVYRTVKGGKRVR